MTDARKARLLFAAIVAAIALGLVLALGGCGKQASTTTPAAPAGETAMDALKVAKSSLSTTAPDSKMLIVQTAGIVTTAAPEWEFLLGAPKTDVVYAVVVKDGKVVQGSEYGTANLSAAEWAAVPAADAWKIDSPDAYSKALAAYPAGTKQTAYTMGFVTYIPKQSSQPNTKAMTWMVTFDPSSMNSKVTTNTIYVDATTGAVTVPK